MDRAEAIHSLLRVIAYELLHHVREQEAQFKDRWLPAADIKDKLRLNFDTVPKGGTQRGEKGWLFALLARMLEDEGSIEYRKAGNRAYYRSRQSQRQ